MICNGARVRRRGHPIHTRTFTTKTKAEASGRQVEGEMDRGVFMSRAEAESTTLAEALDRYVAEIIPHKKQAAREARRCTGLKEHLGGISKRFISTIQGKDVVAFIKSRAAGGAGPHTIRLDLALLSRLFNVARTAWGMESLSNPAELVRGQRPKLPHSGTGVWVI